MDNWVKFGIRLPGAVWRAAQDRPILVEATLALALSRVMLLLLPVRWAFRPLGRLGTEATFIPDRAARRQAARVGWAVAVSATRVPWQARCLPRAMAAQLMLRRRGVRGTIYLGLRRCNTTLDAHAWLRVGGCFVTGKAGHEDFTPMASIG